jgi:hypothetical protein
MNQLTQEQQAQMMNMMASMFGMQPAQPQQNFGQSQAFQSQPQSVGLPIGCYGRDHHGVFLAESVDALTSWTETVLAKNGGTHDGLKVKFIELKQLKKNDKSYSERKGYMARFEICKPRGRNPINEVINIFMKDETSHVPYLDPRLWDNRTEEVVFRNIDDDTKNKFRINIITFDDEIISDDIHRKCANILDRLKGLYVYTVDGVEYDEDGPYGADDDATANS